MKWFFLIIPLSVILFIGGLLLIKPIVIETNPAIKENPPQVKEKQSIKIILAGDIMLDRGVEYMINKEGNGDFKFPFLKIANDLKSADILFGNLEGPISDKGERVGSIYSFRAVPKAIEGLSFAGFDVISLANNHAFDYGRGALEDTLKRLNADGVSYAGAGFNGEEAHSPIVKEIKGTKIGFLAYTNLGSPYWKAIGENSGIALVSENDFEKLRNDIQNAKDKVDILIISLHSGEEYFKEPTKFQIDFSRTAIDAGADVVSGHHPHVVQRNEIYQNGYIFYSLGNFIFDQSFSEETMRGQIVEILIENGKIKEAIPREVKISNFFQPEIKQ